MLLAKLYPYTNLKHSPALSEETCEFLLQYCFNCLKKAEKEIVIEKRIKVPELKGDAMTLAELDTL